MRLILASGSPRRRQILKGLGLAFEVRVPHVDEVFDPNRSPEEGAVTNALLKAREIAREVSDAVVLGADTIVVLGDVIFTKPSDDRDAVRMLDALSGQRHRVITGYACIAVGDNGIAEEITGFEVSWVTMRRLSGEEIERYVQEHSPMDKAGSYAIQEIGERFIECIEGDYDNVVGLPGIRIRGILDDLSARFG
ncbi:MAG: Maf family protein [bacterium]